MDFLFLDKSEIKGSECKKGKRRKRNDSPLSGAGIDHKDHFGSKQRTSPVILLQVILSYRWLERTNEGSQPRHRGLAVQQEHPTKIGWQKWRCNGKIFKKKSDYPGENKWSKPFNNKKEMCQGLFGMKVLKVKFY